MNAPDYLRKLDAARRRMAAAKANLTRASEAVHRRLPGAAEKADVAIAELTAARRELNQLLDEDAGNPWAEAARIQGDADE